MPLFNNTQTQPNLTEEQKQALLQQVNNELAKRQQGLSKEPTSIERFGRGAMEAGGRMLRAGVENLPVLFGAKPTEGTEDLKTFEAKERIKQETKKLYEEEPDQFLDVTSPEGYEKTGYSYSGGQYRPKFEKKLKEGAYDKPTLDRATTLRKEFNADKTFKDFQIVSRSVSGLEKAYEIASAPDVKTRIAGDQALGVLFQKMLDPASVVRESEYARTPEGASIMTRILRKSDQLAKGGLTLGDTERMALLEMGRKLLEVGKEQFNQHIDRYTKIADAYQVPPDLIFGGLTKFDLENETQNKSGITSSGLKYTIER